MKTSVIVSTYNRPSALKKVIDGLINQKHLPNEVIIADDGSNNETKILVKNIKKRAPFPIIHIWQRDKGFRLSRIKNKAIKIAQYEYIIFLDGDCIPHKFFIADHLFLAEKGYFVQGKRILVGQKIEPFFSYKEANSLIFLLKAILTNKISNWHHIFRIKKFPCFKNRKLRGIKGCNMSFFKEDLIAINGFNEDFIGWGREDSELVVRCYNYGLYRKEHPFLAICFHLWHPPAPKNNLLKNELLLEKILKTDKYFCDNGILKRK
ncbi:glycosyl transferase family 2 [Thermodesulfatator indicus DSM 15286]|uniref:Glycosyl transferase family 2 n=1 Tax=Thermodesulfatator indicus (strain DSM 15286 / JCM 11887 / CIR29812) TaxID=667014 RepID=F8AC14_THEID|nr:glycosyltransferase family 2 protein [Thermodesulfatator indicus]AEH44569.1 glycosyl transferase family 2 [Thermodesulfatator indicus DSM 15286]